MTLPRITEPVRLPNKALWDELAGPVTEERLREIEASWTEPKHEDDADAA